MILAAKGAEEQQQPCSFSRSRAPSLLISCDIHLLQTLVFFPHAVDLIRPFSPVLEMSTDNLVSLHAFSVLEWKTSLN